MLSGHKGESTVFRNEKSQRGKRKEMTGLECVHAHLTNNESNATMWGWRNKKCIRVWFKLTKATNTKTKTGCMYVCVLLYNMTWGKEIWMMVPMNWFFIYYRRRSINDTSTWSLKNSINLDIYRHVKLITKTKKNNQK